MLLIRERENEIRSIEPVEAIAIAKEAMKVFPAIGGQLSLMEWQAS